MILRFLAGSVTFHLLYYILKNVVAPALFGQETSKAVIAEIAKRLVDVFVYFIDVSWAMIICNFI